MRPDCTKCDSDVLLLSECRPTAVIEENRGKTRSIILPPFPCNPCSSLSPLKAVLTVVVGALKLLHVTHLGVKMGVNYITTQKLNAMGTGKDVLPAA